MFGRENPVYIQHREQVAEHQFWGGKKADFTPKAKQQCHRWSEIHQLLRCVQFGTINSKRDTG